MEKSPIPTSMAARHLLPDPQNPNSSLRKILLGNRGNQMDIYDKVVQANEWALEDIPIAIKNNIKAGKEKYYRVPWNYDSLIRSYIELGVLNWKKGVNPTNDFRNAHKAFKKRQRFISKKKLKPLNVEVPFYFAMYLIDETIFDLPSLTSEELKYEYHVYVR